MLNAEIFKLLDEKTLKATKKLAQDFGEPELLKGYGQRNTTRLAVAPTTSSAFILGQVSQSIEPLKSNYYIKELAKRKHVYKNPFLEELLEEKGLNDRETWLSIMKNDGSVQHLSELSEREKAVFKTFREISQLEVIQQAAQRQKYIDQGQSLNIIVNPQTPVKELNWLLCEAHKLGIKSLYYQHSVNAAQEFSQSLTKCVSCEG
jgi:ribonucleoside-diphosphate reductase alpha chain